MKAVLPSLLQSCEWLCHETGNARFMLPLRGQLSAEVRAKLAKPRLERAVGVICRPETELDSHYFQAVLPEKFDEIIWFDRTSAVTPFETTEIKGLLHTYPFGLSHRGPRFATGPSPFVGLSESADPF
jgi:protein-L-isoaspartate(D-aspartate) O-methyltransferase